MLDQNDLEIALSFVTRRIGEEAVRSGQSLSVEEQALLEDLPTESVLPDPNSSDSEALTLRPPRDLAYERLCALAKQAHRRDLQFDPSGRDWQFALAVTALNRHPMSWLLGWAEVKGRRAWWDGCLLVVTALVCICTWMALMFVGTESHLRFRWLIVAAGAATLIAAMGFGARWMQQSQLRRTIEKNRPQR